MTIEKLKRYRELKAELEDVNWKLQTVCDSVQGSQEDYPYILQNHRISGVEPKNYKLLEHKSDLKVQIKEIEDFVRGIKNYNLKKAVTLQYIKEIEEGEDKPTWEIVVNKIPGETSDSLKSKLRRILKKRHE